MRKSAFAAWALLLAAPGWAGPTAPKISAVEPIKPLLSPQNMIFVNALTALAPLPMQGIGQQTLPQLEPLTLTAQAPLNANPAEAAPDYLGPGMTLTKNEHGTPVLTVNFDGDKLHPFERISPPDLGALDTREVRAAKAVSSTPAYVPPFVGRWLQKRRAHALKTERMTTEEYFNRESLVKVHALIRSGDPQTALDELTASFDNSRARDWYAENPDHKPYWETAMTYYRAIEKGLKKDLTTVKKRSKDAALIAASKAGVEKIGGTWRPTRIQARHSGHCAFHAWHNAIAASTGWVGGADVSRLIAAARAALNETQAPLKVDAETARELGLRVTPRDLGDGLNEKTTKELADWLGIPYKTMPAPQNEAELLTLLRSGAQIVQVLRLFHDGHRHDPQLAAILGHDHPVGLHAAYVLGAFKSAEHGGWMYMVQDSGSGTTDFYTFAEFRSLTKELEVLAPKGPVAIPARN